MSIQKECLILYKQTGYIFLFRNRFIALKPTKCSSVCIDLFLTEASIRSPGEEDKNELLRNIFSSLP